MTGEFLARKRRGRIEGVIFHWRSADPSTFRMGFALVAAAGLFAAFLFFVKVRVVPLPRPAERKGELLLIPQQANMGDWATMALESGPFPSRFEPAQSPIVNDLEREAMAGLHLQSGDYRPRLSEWPTENRAAAPVPTAMVGQRVLPKLELTPWSPPAHAAGRLQPALVAISRMPDGVWPQQWPPFEGALDPAAAAVPWRFMLRLADDGRVSDCIVLSGTNEPGAAQIEGWLRQVRFGHTLPADEWLVVETRVIQAP